MNRCKNIDNNGDVKGEDTETLNHFDAHTRYQFERMLYVYGTGMTGQKSFTAYTGMSYLPSEINIFGTIQQPFRTMDSRPYDPQTNSITIGVGSRFDLGNGYKFPMQSGVVSIISGIPLTSALNATRNLNRVLKKHFGLIIRRHFGN